MTAAKEMTLINTIDVFSIFQTGASKIMSTSFVELYYTDEFYVDLSALLDGLFTVTVQCTILERFHWRFEIIKPRLSKSVKVYYVLSD